MSRVSGSYKTLLGGVSTQEPTYRREGQHTEQVNIISDPLKGLRRRTGSVRLAHKEVPTSYYGDGTDFKSQNIKLMGRDFFLLYKHRPNGDDKAQTLMTVYDIENGRYLDVRTNPSDQYLKRMIHCGVRALQVVGDYILFSMGDEEVESTIQQNYTPTSMEGLLWVKEGDYSTEYILKFEEGLSIFEYTTPSMNYTGAMDLDNMPTDDTKWQQEYNRRSAQHNQNIEKHMAESTEAIQPSKIIERITQGIDSSVAKVKYKHDRYAWVDIVPSRSHNWIAESGGKEEKAFLYIRDRVESIEDLPPVFVVGKVLQVSQPTAELDEVKYYKAESVQKYDGDLHKVKWREIAGEEVLTNNKILLATVEGDSLYIASDADLMADLLQEDNAPSLITNKIGDRYSMNTPAFYDNPIDYIGMFQDRLIIGSGNKLSFSRTGDYMNFFPKSISEVSDDDPVEITADGSDNDIIKNSVSFNKDLIFFGELNQYILDGRSQFTPSRSMVQYLSNYESDTQAQPTTSGGSVFYAVSDSNGTYAYQMQVGDVVDTPVSDNLSEHIRGYIRGTAIEIKALTDPQHLVVRSTGNPLGFYIYSYTDDIGTRERLFDSWSRWKWSDKLGTLIGVNTYEGEIYAHYHRAGRLVCDKFTLPTDGVQTLYIDSSVEMVKEPYPEEWDYVVVKGDEEYGTVGYAQGEDSTHLKEVQGERMIGYSYDSYVQLTRPYIRDRETGEVITTGRQVVSSIDVVTEATPRYVFTFIRYGGEPIELPVHNFKVGGDRYRLGSVVRPNSLDTFGVRTVVTELDIEIGSYRWYPMTVTQISWEGFYDNTRRRY